MVSRPPPQPRGGPSMMVDRPPSELSTKINHPQKWTVYEVNCLQGSTVREVNRLRGWTIREVNRPCRWNVCKVNCPQWWTVYQVNYPRDKLSWDKRLQVKLSLVNRLKVNCLEVKRHRVIMVYLFFAICFLINRAFIRRRYGIGLSVIGISVIGLM